MLRLAVTTRAETYKRMQGPLAERSIRVEHVPTAERTFTPGADLGAFDVGFVYPPRLPEGGVADALLGVPWVNNREAVLRSRYKGETLARLAAAVPTPETVVVSDPVEEATLVETFRRFDPPVVVKPNSATRGVGVTKVADLDSFLGVCDYLDLVHDYRATGDRSFLVQEYLPNARDYRVMVVDGECVGAVERRRPEARDAGLPTAEHGDPTDRWKHNVHRGATATAVDLPERLRELAEAAAATLSIPWLGVDLLVTEDRAVVNETNARPTIDAGKYEQGFWDEVAALVRRQR